MIFVIILLIYANCVILNTVWGHLTNIKRLSASIECKKLSLYEYDFEFQVQKIRLSHFYKNMYEHLCSAGNKKQNGPIRD